MRKILYCLLAILSFTFISCNKGNVDSGKIIGVVYYDSEYIAGVGINEDDFRSMASKASWLPEKLAGGGIDVKGHIVSAKESRGDVPVVFFADDRRLGDYRETAKELGMGSGLFNVISTDGILRVSMKPGSPAQNDRPVYKFTLSSAVVQTIQRLCPGGEPLPGFQYRLGFQDFANQAREHDSSIQYRLLSECTLLPPEVDSIVQSYREDEQNGENSLFILSGECVLSFVAIDENSTLSVRELSRSMQTVLHLIPSVYIGTIPGYPILYYLVDEKGEWFSPLDEVLVADASKDLVIEAYGKKIY